MNRRIQSMQLMKGLQPFTQTGLVSAQGAKSIVDEYVKGNSHPLEELVFSPGIPMQYISLVKGLKNFIQ